MVTLSFFLNFFVICCHLVRSVQSARYTLMNWAGAVLGITSALLAACLSVSLCTQFDLPPCFVANMLKSSRSVKPEPLQVGCDS